MSLRSSVFLACAAICVVSTIADTKVGIDETKITPQYRSVAEDRRYLLPASESLDYPAINHGPAVPRPRRPLTRPATGPRYRRDVETDPEFLEADNENEYLHREARFVSQSQFPRPVSRPTPSPTFPRPPTSGPRYRRDVETEVEDVPSSSAELRFRRDVDTDVEEAPRRTVRTIQPYKFPSTNPQTRPTFPRPGDLRPQRPHMRFRRRSGSVSVDVDKNRGQRTTTRVTGETNVYRSDNGRTRVDASAYATNRGDRGGSINFSHRF